MLRRLIDLLLVAAELWRRWRRTEEQQQHAGEVDEIRKSPGDWLDGHFNGVRGDTAVPDNASDADKANAAKRSRDV